MRLSLIPLLALAVACTTDDTDTPSDDTDAVETDETDVPEETDDTDPIETDDTDPVETDETEDTDPPAPRVAAFDATSSTDWVYVDLVSGAALPLDEAAAAASTAWHVALRRSEIRTNGGDSGPGEVTVALVDAQEDLYDAEGNPVRAAFEATDADTELAALLATFTPPEAWASDAIADALGEDWYVYNFSNGNITHNADAGFLVRGGEGTSYGRLRVTDLNFPTRTGQGIQSFTAELHVQASGADAFAETPVTFTGTIGGAGGALCYDMDAAATVACTGTAWDLQLAFVGRSFWLRTNSGEAGEGAGGALGPYPWDELAAWTSGATDPQGAPLASRYRTDSSKSLIGTEGWYAYNLAGDHRLSPNFRVWLVDADGEGTAAPVFALQVLDYYDAGGASGHVSLRWREVEAP